MEAHSLITAIGEHLERELGDRETARALADLLGEDALSWRAPQTDPAQIDTIMAFTFGNRMLPNGNRAPGPVNEALADVAVRLHRLKGARIYAQGRWPRRSVPARRGKMLTPIYPGRDERAEPVYLSTGGVVSAVIALQADRRSLGTVGVVGFSDHLWRCVTTLRQSGVAAFAPAGFAMPGEYDPQSGQPWCRSRLAYLTHDIMIRASERRGRLIGRSTS